MSDDDRDMDMFSEDDDFGDDDLGEKISVSPHPNSKPMTQAEKRAHHNALERKRRDHIKDSFTNLRDAVPSLHGEKVSKRISSRAQILKKAAEYIQFMRRKNSAHQHDIEDLKRQNLILENQIRSLEQTRSTGGSVRGGLSAAGMIDVKSIKTRVSESEGSDGELHSNISSPSTSSSTSSCTSTKKIKIVVGPTSNKF